LRQVYEKEFIDFLISFCPLAFAESAAPDSEVTDISKPLKI
jgi:hypothetical protein